MIGRSANLVGLAVSDRAISCAELSLTGDRRVVRRTATFTLPSELSLEQPAAVGQALASFLRAKRFSATRAVMGVPARWLFAQEKELPPAGETEARAALRLQAERLAIAESGDVVCDFVGRPSESAPTRVLLVGMLRERLERVEALADAAGMSLVAVTSTGLTLAACANRGAGAGAGAGRENDGPMLVLARSGAEMVVQDDGLPRMLRHVSFTMNGHGMPPVAPLGAELRRAVTLSPGDSGRDLLLVDAVGVSEEQVQELAARLGVPVRTEAGLNLLGIHPAAAVDPANDHPVAQYAVPLSLALAGAKPELLPLDFRHSRLTPAPPRRISRPVAWAATLALIAVAAIASLFILVQRQQAELDGLESQLAELKPDVQAAQATVDRVTYGRGFFQTRPPILDSLREVTMSFRDDERIWVTSFAFREGGRVTISGRSVDQRTALALVDRLKQNQRFLDVKMPGGFAEADSRTREVSFSVSFVYNPAAEPAGGAN